MTIALKHVGVLHATVMCNDSPRCEKKELYLNLGGLDSIIEKHVLWPQKDFKTGDVITIEVLDQCTDDEPDHVYSKHQKGDRERSKNYLRKQAKELGWVIDEAGEK